MSKTLNITELAEHLGVTRQTVHKWLKDNRIPIDPIPGLKPPKWRLRDIEEWLGSETEA
jgi:excisionase family DNA binding protein